MAGPNGTVVFNWQDEGGYLDAEVTRPHYVEWMQIVPGRPARHGAFEYVTFLGGQWVSVPQAQLAQPTVPGALADRCTAAVTTLYNAVERLAIWARTSIAGTP
jgi:hypothetical protein